MLHKSNIFSKFVCLRPTECSRYMNDYTVIKNVEDMMIFGFFFTIFYSVFRAVFLLIAYLFKGVGQIISAIVSSVDQKNERRHT